MGFEAASAMVNTTQQIAGSIGAATFSSLAATAVANYLKAHAATATHTAAIADATIVGYHLVFWIAAAVFLAGAALATRTLGLFWACPVGYGSVQLTIARSGGSPDQRRDGRIAAQLFQAPATVRADTPGRDAQPCADFRVRH